MDINLQGVVYMLEDLYYLYKCNGNIIKDFVSLLEYCKTEKLEIYAIVVMHTPIGRYNSCGINFKTQTNDGMYYLKRFNLSVEADKVIEIIRNKSYEKYLVGPNINGFADGCRQEKLKESNFWDTTLKLYPNIDPNS
jgi:hypothetical protein